MTSSSRSGCLYRNPSHIPPNLVVGRFNSIQITSGGEDLQVEHPVWCGYSPAFYFHPTQARVLGSPLIGNQVIQMRQAGEKRCLTPTGVMKPLHREELAVKGVVGLVQQRAAGRHLWVFEYRIPPGFLVLEPVAYALAVL